MQAQKHLDYRKQIILKKIRSFCSYLIKMMDLQAKLVVTFVWGIISFQTISYLYLYVPLLYEYNFGFCIFIVPIFITVVSILCVSYYKSIYSQPGYTNYHVVNLNKPQNLHYNDEIEQLKQKTRSENQMKKIWRNNRKKGQINMQEIQSLNSITYCFKCDLVKEQRVHHCKICKKCIIRMDHHCPWVGNCVGKLNHKYFILFLLYATTGLSMVAITFTIDWLTGQFYATKLNQLQYYTYYFACITSYMLATSIGFLFVTQMITATQNITTLESFTEGITKRNPFDRMSKMQNLREIFGSSIWFLPTDPFPCDSPLINGSIDVL